MTSFSAKGLRQIASYIIVCLLVCLCAQSSPLYAQAQQSEDLFRASWIAKSPDNGAIILMLKRNGRAAYFWAENADRTVYQGTWTSTEESATMTWSDGSTHELQREALGFSITYLSLIHI